MSSASLSPPTSSTRPRAPSASSLPPPSSDTRLRSGSSASSSSAMGINHTQTEPALSAATSDFDVGRQPPSSQSSTDTIMSSPRQQPARSSDQLAIPTSEPPAEGEELARTTTSSSGFSTQSSNGGVEVGSKRDREWREHFDLTDDEELVDSTGCALSKEILVHGRIFISTHSVGFKANILGFKTKVHFPFNQVVSIVPKMTALVIPNAIEFTMDDDHKYSFSTLPSRDATLDVCLALWRAQNPDAYSSFVASQPADSPSARRASFSSVRSSMSGPPSNDGTARHRGSSDAAPAAASAVTGVKGNKAQLNGVTEDAGESHPATKAETKAFDEKCLDVRFPTTPEKVYNLIFHDDEFTKELWKKQKFTDIKINPWTDGKRTTEYTKPLSGSVGPSFAKCLFTEEILHADPEGWYGVLTITKTPEVPSGKSFEVQTKTLITWEGGQKGGARVVATSQVEWSGRSMLKSVINSSSIQGQKDYNKALSTATRAHIKAHAKEFLAEGETHGGGDVDDEVDDEEESAETTQASGKPGVVDYLMQDPVRAAVMALLAVSLLVNLWAILSGGGGGGGVGRRSGGGHGLKGGKIEVAGALERLERIEREWEGVRVCLGGQFGGLLEG